MMRELVYLSTNKLGQFVPQLQAAWPSTRLRVTAPFVEAEVQSAPEASDPQIKHLSRTVNHIKRNAKWFTDPDVFPGQWIAFAAPFNYVIFPGNTLLFVDLPIRTEEYSTGGAIRLLLHGSAKNLAAGLQPAQVTELDDRSDSDSVDIAVRTWRGGTSSDASRHEPSSGPGYVQIVDANTMNLLRARMGEGERETERELEGGDRLHARLRYDGSDDLHVTAAQPFDLIGATRLLINDLDRQVLADTAAWMSGYARVTACRIVTSDPLTGPRGCVVASPLYVERVPDPSSRNQRSPRRFLRWRRGA
ncbi:SAVMC3_10250 family protein [Streptomyces sp. NPDC048665]|uniref:SAVMC3_10250 family protein n=1 Tax=Streptomyces sp. NPDC048665 TaxID=3155490 RepID=UPI00344A7757